MCIFYSSARLHYEHSGTIGSVLLQTSKTTRLSFSWPESFSTPTSITLWPCGKDSQEALMLEVRSRIRCEIEKYWGDDLVNKNDGIIKIPVYFDFFSQLNRIVGPHIISESHQYIQRILLFHYPYTLRFWFWFPNDTFRSDLRKLHQFFYYLNPVHSPL